MEIHHSYEKKPFDQQNLLPTSSSSASGYTRVTQAQPYAPVPVSYAPNSHPSAPPRPIWSVDLFEVGDCGSCVYSFACPCMAAATSRNILDGSDWYANCFFLTPAALRFMTRTGYGIEGNAVMDAWSGGFCPCCTVNQVYQTVKSRGQMSTPQGLLGPNYLVQDYEGFARRSRKGLAYDACYALCCTPCAVGYVTESAGMPCWFGMCCVSPLLASNIQRYRRRLKPSCCYSQREDIDDFWLPFLTLCGLEIAIRHAPGSLASLAAFPFLLRSLVEENVAVFRPEVGYGCVDVCFSTLVPGLCDCVSVHHCQRCGTIKEGRYLHEDA